MTGLIDALRGEAGRARARLVDAAAGARRDQFLPPEFVSGWGLAVVAELDGDGDAAAERYRALLARWRQSEDRHYALTWLHWATTFFAMRGAAADVRACAGALAEIAAEGGNPEALAVLGHALGEAALLDGEADQAARHFVAALDRLDGLDLPFARAQIALRAGAALTAAGEREAAVMRLTEAERVARRLGVRLLHDRAVAALAALGEPPARRLGRREAGRLERGGLTARELEVVRLAAAGHSNRQISDALVLSPRTVEMHIGNVLSKLGCRSRTEAGHRARQLGLLE
jgi:ATP/maltotriose-dependent transcriptional regulator MalT